MLGKAEPQPDFLTVINLDAIVPPQHPLRAIKSRVDAVLKKLSPLFDDLMPRKAAPAFGLSNCSRGGS
jgi:hypothetical protein